MKPQFVHVFIYDKSLDFKFPEIEPPKKDPVCIWAGKAAILDTNEKYDNILLLEKKLATKEGEAKCKENTTVCIDKLHSVVCPLKPSEITSKLKKQYEAYTGKSAEPMTVRIEKNLQERFAKSKNGRIVLHMKKSNDEIVVARTKLQGESKTSEYKYDVSINGVPRHTFGELSTVALLIDDMSRETQGEKNGKSLERKLESQKDSIISEISIESQVVSSSPVKKRVLDVNRGKSSSISDRDQNNSEFIDKKVTAGKTAGFIGLAPKDLWKYDEKSYDKLVDNLVPFIQKLSDDGYDKFITNGEQGFDQCVFKAVDIVKSQGRSVSNVVYVPFPNRDSMWPKDGLFGKKEYSQMLHSADEYKCVAEDAYTVPVWEIDSYLGDANCSLCADSDLVIALTSDKLEQTWAYEKFSNNPIVCGLQYAEKHGKSITTIDKNTFEITWDKHASDVIEKSLISEHKKSKTHKTIKTADSKTRARKKLTPPSTVNEVETSLSRYQKSRLVRQYGCETNYDCYMKIRDSNCADHACIDFQLESTQLGQFIDARALNVISQAGFCKQIRNRVCIDLDKLDNIVSVDDFYEMAKLAGYNPVVYRMKEENGQNTSKSVPLKTLLLQGYNMSKRPSDPKTMIPVTNQFAIRMLELSISGNLKSLDGSAKDEILSKSDEKISSKRKIRSKSLVKDTSYVDTVVAGFETDASREDEEEY